MTIGHRAENSQAEHQHGSCAVLAESGHCACCDVRHLSVCAALEGDELFELQRILRPSCFQPKTTLFMEGDLAQSVFVVTRGVVRLYKLLDDGRRQIIGFALPGDFLGLALADRYGFSADAVDLVSACRFSRPSFSAIVAEKPALMRRLFEFATHELSLAQDHMVMLGRRNAEEKLSAFLMEIKARWTRINGASPTVPLPMSRQDIADYLGLTIETVSRTITRLARQKAIVVVPDGIRVLDQPRLERALAA